MPHLHGECGVDAVVEVQIGGAVVGPVCDPQVTVSDPAVQLLLYGVLLDSHRNSIFCLISGATVVLVLCHQEEPVPVL